MIVELTRLAPESNEAGLQFEKEFKQQNSEEHFKKLMNNKRSQEEEEDAIDKLIRESLGTTNADNQDDKMEFLELEGSPKFDYDVHYSYLELPYAFMLGKLIDITEYDLFTKLEFSSDVEVLVKEKKAEIVNKIRQTIADSKIKH